MVRAAVPLLTAERAPTHRPHARHDPQARPISAHTSVRIAMVYRTVVGAGGGATVRSGAAQDSSWSAVADEFRGRRQSEPSGTVAGRPSPPTSRRLMDDNVQFEGRRVLYTWIGGTRRDWRDPSAGAAVSDACASEVIAGLPGRWRR